MDPDTPVHATAVAVADRAVLIRGASGRGKSGLALRMIALGAVLVADDRVVLTRRGGLVHASCPAALRGLIEARGMGLLRTPPAPPTPLACVVDLDHHTTARLPVRQSVTVLGCDLPLLHPAPGLDFAAALMLYMRGGRND
ncbi:Hpr(Ser) kinase/phosphatase [Loktanella atrilutea]|uniref:Hpr(Ser) kinase/phosphatase n=1 Tax=Loktanella atrilutea TaxID=366533 RepID=A0A1M4ZPQ2_LOKAT|nr:HPr kinase/phosphatase C-terminal domain-containing protein [Loktanella atrilutea]SHF19984.1 Hpr(Ser) kinase/phosphatase [Loktanella atrilutea]